MFFFLHLFALNKNILNVSWTFWNLFFHWECRNILKSFWEPCMQEECLRGHNMRIVVSNRCRKKPQQNRLLMEQITAENAFWTSLCSCNPKIDIFVIYGSDHPLYPVTELRGMVQSCVRGDSDWTLGSITLLRKLEQAFWRSSQCPKPVSV